MQTYISRTSFVRKAGKSDNKKFNLFSCEGNQLQSIHFHICRYERHFTPNVSLAPSANNKGKGEEDTEKEQAEELTVKPKVVQERKSNLPNPSTLQITMDNGREYREYDLPTDTDDSSVGQSSPLDGKSFYSGSGKKKIGICYSCFYVCFGHR